MPDYLLPSAQFPGSTVLASTSLPLEHVSCCPQCGTVLGTKAEGNVSLHLVDPTWSCVSGEGFGLRPLSPPRTMSQDATKAECPYCGAQLEVSTVVQRDPDGFRTLKM